MATSLITKKALAASFIDLIEQKPFEKISISDICDGCDMNRKSFYYHFKDKHDLVNWIFDYDIKQALDKKYYENAWDLMRKIAEVFDNKSSFYKKVMQIKGQNSFIEHFVKVFSDISLDNFRGTLDKGVLKEFQLNFIADAFGKAYERWILEYDDMSTKEFIAELDICMKYLSDIYEEYEETELELV